MSQPLIDRLTGELGYALVDEANVDSFAASHRYSVLFFAGEPKRTPESLDVAVILPELMKVFGERVVPAVVAANAEAALQSRYGFQRWPTLVFLRGGEYLGAISQMQDWDAYLNQIEQLLASEPRRAPIPIAPASGSGGCGASA